MQNHTLLTQALCIKQPAFFLYKTQHKPPLEKSRVNKKKTCKILSVNAYTLLKQTQKTDKLWSETISSQTIANSCSICTGLLVQVLAVN